MFEIKSDVPPPTRNNPGELTGRPGRPMEYPWDKMMVGDSVLLSQHQAPNARGSIAWYRRNNPGQRFVTRKEDGGLRVWRVE